ncbi:MAG: sulfite exporter TauE/SafE family protein, partial [Anaerolineales bacterium]|nr:sulfite exporter TauE/SafE family protein [Anaerolineales bacterium]
METNIILFIVVGFLAQMIDGALGMAYGVSSNTFLLSLGIPPAAASASVHMAEVVTTGISGASHWRLGNVDWKLVRRLLVPGVIGGVIGAYVLTSIDGDIIKPYIAVYLLVMGGVIIYKAFTMIPRKKPDE